MNTPFLERNPGMKYETATRSLRPYDGLSGSSSRREEIDTLTNRRGIEYAKRTREISQTTWADGSVKTRISGYCSFELGDARISFSLGDFSNVTRVSLSIHQSVATAHPNLPYYDVTSVGVGIYYIEKDKFLKDRPDTVLSDNFPEQTSLGVNLNVELHDGGRATILSKSPPFKNGILFKQMQKWRRGQTGALNRDSDYFVDDYCNAQFAFRIDKADEEEAGLVVDNPEIELYKLLIPRFRTIEGMKGDLGSLDLIVTFPTELPASLRQRILEDGEDWLELFDEPSVRLSTKSSEDQTAQFDAPEDN